MNLISDTGDLMSFDWVFGDIQVKKKGYSPCRGVKQKFLALQ